MAQVHDGRFTADLGDRDEVVVLLIGMRFTRPWKVRRWAPVAAAMPRMLVELQRQPELGMLGAHTWFGRTIVVLQYWESFDALHAYAHATDAAHLPAWRAFNRAVGASGDVGIWHETYAVPADRVETVYGNMPRFGLAAATGHVPATGRRRTARQRMQRDDDD